MFLGSVEAMATGMDIFFHGIVAFFKREKVRLTLGDRRTKP